jgi:glycosyltransferase involved in cell wall biosynthesis
VVKEPLGHDDLAAEMANFDIFCHMASGDPAPNVVLEALSTGLPVIYKVSGGTPEMVGERRYGVPLMNTSVEAMQNAVEESLERYISLTQTIKAEREKFLIDFAAPAYASVLKEAALQYAR